MQFRVGFTSTLAGLRVTGLACLLHPADAFATGGLSCHVDDRNMSFDVAAGFSYGGSGGLFGVSGDISVKSADLPAELARRAIDQGMLVQQWLDGKDLRLQLYAESSGAGPFASVMLTIITEQSPDDELTYSGTYNLKIQMPEPLADGNATIIEQKGKVGCSVG